jgi:hypothetical protein
MTTSFRGGRSRYLELHGSVILPSTVGIGQYNTWHPCNSRYLRKIFLYIVHNHMEYLYNIIYSYKYLESNLIKHCHMIFIHSLGQPLIVRSHSKVHRSQGNSHVFPIIVTSLDSIDNKHGMMACIQSLGVYFYFYLITA